MQTKQCIESKWKVYIFWHLICISHYLYFRFNFLYLLRMLFLLNNGVLYCWFSRHSLVFCKTSNWLTFARFVSFVLWCFCCWFSFFLFKFDLTVLARTQLNGRKLEPIRLRNTNNFEQLTFAWAPNQSYLYLIVVCAV